MINLILGTSACLIAVLYIDEERSKNKYHQEISSIYQILQNQRSESGSINTIEETSLLLSEQVKSTIPEVKEVARAKEGARLLFSVGELSNYEIGWHADRSLFKIFDFKLLSGSRDIPVGRHSIFVSEKLARKYFNNINVAGKVIRIQNETDFVISGVFEDITRHSSLQFDFVVPIEYFTEGNKWALSWTVSTLKTYAMLRDDARVERVNTKLSSLINAHIDKNRPQLMLYPFEEMYLNGVFSNGVPQGGRIYILRLLIAVTFFVGLITLVNYVNLTATNIVKRTKEIRMRKILGGQGLMLVLNLFFELCIAALLSYCFALLVVSLVIPLLNQQLTINLILDSSKILILVLAPVIILLVTAIGAFFPGIYFLRTKMISIGSMEPAHFGRGIGIRKTLMVAQFALVGILLTLSVIIHQQIQFVNSLDPGYQHDNVLVFEMENEAMATFSAIKNKLYQHPNFIEVGRSNQLPMEISMSSSDLSWTSGEKVSNQLMKIIFVDHDFVPSVGMRVVSGRNFSEDFNDELNFMVNESAARSMQLKQPIGQRLQFWKGEGEIIAVVEDFNNQSLYDKVDPVIFVLWPENSYLAFVRTKNTPGPDDVAFIKSVGKELNLIFPFEVQELSTYFFNHYKSDVTISRLCSYFTGIALISSLVGLVGLSYFNSARRSREISVRKVYGASATNILAGFYTEYTYLVIYAAMVFIPVSYFLASLYLSRFSYHAEISIFTFPLMFLAILLVTIITVTYHSVKTSLTNPSEVLKHE